LVDFDAELAETRKEVDRLGRNWQALLDVMPELVLLVGDDCVIEYMNRSARERLGDLRFQKCDQGLQEACSRCSISSPQHQDVSPPEELFETVVNGVPVECSAVPFAGYTGACLTMVVMRDVGQRKVFEREILEFNTNIERILVQKIAELQESEELRSRLSHEVNSLKNRLGHYHRADKMVGSSRKTRELREMIHQVAKSDATILITGESGTGKELVANLIKATSNRDNKPFLKINCNAINDSILESDLFGYEKGAFTGAATRKKGKFEVVDGGTIFLDEIGDISSRMQAALLRVLQNGEIVRVGGTEPIKVDVRILAATNIDLITAVQEKTFRLDLYYRLNIINIDIPPLRERKEEIIELVSYFVKYYREAFNKEIDFVPQSIIDRLLVHDWPGNIRELENLIQRAVLMAKGKMITEQELMFDQVVARSPAGEKKQAVDVQEKLGQYPLKIILADFEREVIEESLSKWKGNVSKAATELSLGKTALYDKMKRYDISAKMIKKYSYSRY
jgi:transcriptional regulator with PAS, ATPase and Fis domain